MARRERVITALGEQAIKANRPAVAKAVGTAGNEAQKEGSGKGGGGKKAKAAKGRSGAAPRTAAARAERAAALIVRASYEERLTLDGAAFQGLPQERYDSPGFRATYTGPIAEAQVRMNLPPGHGFATDIVVDTSPGLTS